MSGVVRMLRRRERVLIALAVCLPVPVLAAGRRPLVDVGLLEALLGLRLNRLAHLPTLRLKRVPELAATVEEETIHAVEDTAG
jgi:hypothetical protein